MITVTRVYDTADKAQRALFDVLQTIKRYGECGMKQRVLAEVFDEGEIPIPGQYAVWIAVENQFAATLAEKLLDHHTPIQVSKLAD